MCSSEHDLNLRWLCMHPCVVCQGTARFRRCQQTGENSTGVIPPFPPFDQPPGVSTKPCSFGVKAQGCSRCPSLRKQATALGPFFFFIQIKCLFLSTDACAYESQHNSTEGHAGAMHHFSRQGLDHSSGFCVTTAASRVLWYAAHVAGSVLSCHLTALGRNCVGHSNTTPLVSYGHQTYQTRRYSATPAGTSLRSLPNKTAKTLGARLEKEKAVYWRERMRKSQKA